jgi:glucose-6-phosphate isomerase
MIAGPDTHAWRALSARAEETRHVSLRGLFDADAQRAGRFSRFAAGLFVDFSRQRVDDDGFALLCALADDVQLRARIDAMWRGEVLNATESRQVLHTALRVAPGATDGPGGPTIVRAVLGERAKMLRFATELRAGMVLGSSGKPIEHVVNIGIGGSDLGPVMATQALRSYTAGAPKVAFVSNVDGTDLAEVLEGRDAARTLFIVASKSFVTQETFANARSARAWIVGQLGEAAVPQHFAAVSTNATAMDEFGVNPNYRFMMWDWVGGRYSLWSSIGLSVAVAIGPERFLEFLGGGAEMDEHFRTAAWHDNLPVLMALFGEWNINFLGLPTLAVLPYDGRLRRFPAYLQQLDMESNGKRVAVDGTTVSVETAPIVWGEPGNNAQHSFFQMLHQGTPRAALDFLLPANSSCGNQPQAELAIGNCLAQADAFAFGYTEQQATDELKARNVPAEHIATLAKHKIHTGNRPATVILFERLDAATLGRLVALYEHKVFVQGVLWGINSYDQWGVELGKKMCAAVLPIVRDSAAPPPKSLAALVRQLRAWRK